ncbi:probable cytochrome P450 6a23 [Bactrocera tryoni]|uniref:probable cytochrome P450 6a23 n=1 Tax=Bactrocera tryoni TaxID=59916 RepID=UPI001A97C455|nr:probable cytochrome P450 6a23 [Bactrocera tryoni]
MSIFLNLLVLSIVLLLAFLKYRHGYWKRRGVPHEAPHFPLGDFKEWRSTKCFFEILAPIYRKFKDSAPFAGMFMAFRPVALILDPDLVKSILIKDFNHFRERGVFSNVRDDPLTGHLFALEGTKWRELRQKLSTAFSSGKMKHMHPIVVKVAEEFKKVLEEKQATAADGVIEITDLLSRFTADIIGVCAFGIECNSLRNPQADFVVMGRKANIDRRHGFLLDTFIEAAPKLARTLRMRQTTQEVNDFYMGIVRETIEYRERTGVKRNDLMDTLLELKSKDGNDGGLTVNEIAAQAFVFLIAGFETSSSTMGYVLYELAKWQDIQNRLRAEINTVLERHNNQLTYESMQDMRYMEQVLSETLRRYPIVGHLVREADIDYKTADPRFTIEKGTMVIIPVYELHHDHQYFPNPEKFDPDRFSEAEIKTRPACTYLPFGDGPRNCIGLRFGKMQVCIGLTYLLRHFKFSVCEETEERLSFQVEKIILQPINGIKLRVQRL